MAAYTTKIVLAALPAMSVYKDDEGVEWLPLSYDSASITQTMGVTVASIKASLASETAAMAMGGVPADWVHTIPVPTKALMECIPYPTFMMMVMLGLLPYSGPLLDVGVIK